VIPRRAVLGGLAAAAGAAVIAACSGKKRAVVGAGSGSGATTSAPRTTSAPTSTTVPAVPQGPARFIAHGPATSTGVALTFHTAGDPAITQSLLAQAAELGAKLTFFVVGTWATANPTVIRAIVDGGHELGNHTWSHVNIQALDAAGMRAEVQKCADVLDRETGSISKWFRPSQTDVPDAAMLAMAGDVGYATSVGYDVDPLDYTDPGAAPVESRVRAAVHGGAIVSLHTLYQGTATAFTPMVRSIQATGLRPVTVSSLLGS
jgi:peptidoglycan/xylan/chitin deacetylase (PgdA/CDA1 family)